MPMKSRSPEKTCGEVWVQFLRHQQQEAQVVFLMRSNLWMNASCCSGCVSDSFQSRAFPRGELAAERDPVISRRKAILMKQNLAAASNQNPRSRLMDFTLGVEGGSRGQRTARGAAVGVARVVLSFEAEVMVVLSFIFATKID
nr:uncharacterized protein LOC109163151 [Ipomoea batatas]